MSDGRAIVDIARQEAVNYRSQYNQQIPIKLLNERISSYMHAYTLFSAVRPFGVSVILSSWNEADGPELYMIEPSGVSCGYFGCAIGKAKQPAKTEIEKFDLSSKTVEELMKEAAKMLVVKGLFKLSERFLINIFILASIKSTMQRRIKNFCWRLAMLAKVRMEFTSSYRRAMKSTIQLMILVHKHSTRTMRKVMMIRLVGEGFFSLNFFLSIQTLKNKNKTL